MKVEGHLGLWIRASARKPLPHGLGPLGSSLQPLKLGLSCLDSCPASQKILSRARSWGEASTALCPRLDPPTVCPAFMLPFELALSLPSQTRLDISPPAASCCPVSVPTLPLKCVPLPRPETHSPKTSALTNPAPSPSSLGINFAISFQLPWPIAIWSRTS